MQMSVMSWGNLNGPNDPHTPKDTGKKKQYIYELIEVFRGSLELDR